MGGRLLPLESSNGQCPGVVVNGVPEQKQAHDSVDNLILSLRFFLSATSYDRNQHPDSSTRAISPAGLVTVIGSLSRSVGKKLPVSGLPKVLKSPPPSLAACTYSARARARARACQAFKELDKPAALAAIARETWADAVESDRAVAEPERLLRFLLLTFADLKKSAFLHWFAFPTLGSQALFRLVSSRPASAAAPGVLLGGPADSASVVRGLAGLWARSVEGTGRPHCPPFFVMVKASRPAGRDDGDGEAVAAGLRVLSLLEFEREGAGGEVGDDTVVFGFVDPCSEPGGMPGWPLRNFLVLLSARWGVKRARVLCFREHVPRASAGAGSGAAAAAAGELPFQLLAGVCLLCGDRKRRS